MSLKSEGEEGEENPSGGGEGEAGDGKSRKISSGSGVCGGRRVYLTSRKAAQWCPPI